MSAEPRPDGSTGPWPGRRPLPWAFAAAAVALVVLYALAVAPSFGLWHLDDDYRNLRWALEYRTTPWLALTRLHSLHDHVRPATLITVWLGAMLGNGRWVGIHAVLIALHLAAICGAGTLAWRLSGRRWAGLLAAALTLSFPGTVLMTQWNAWISSAGELAMGLWGLVALHRSLERHRWPWAALLLLAAAGLYKEPGWIVYPAAACAMVWSAWNRGLRGRRRLAGLGSLPLGLAGLAITWNPTNVVRVEAPGSPLGERIIHSMGTSLSHWIDAGGPLPLPGSSPVDGLHVTLATVALGSALWLPRRGPLVAATWAALLVAVGALLVHTPSLAPWVLLVAIAGVLARRWRTPGPGLVLALAAPAVMAPFGTGDPVQVLAGAFGLAVFTGDALTRLWSNGRPSRPIRALVLLVLALGLTSACRQAAERQNPLRALELQRERDHFLGYGALSFALHQTHALCPGPRQGLEIAPLLPLVLDKDKEPRHPRLLANGRLYFWAPRPLVRQVLFDRNEITGESLPLLRAPGTPRPSPSGPARQSEFLAPEERGHGLLLEDLEPGFYAAGYVLRKDAGDSPLALQLIDGCGALWRVDSTAGEAEIHVETVRVRAQCPSLDVSQSGAGRRDVEWFFLARLPHPRVSMWAARDVPRLLDVGADANDEVLCLGGEAASLRPPPERAADGAPPSRESGARRDRDAGARGLL